MSYWKLFMSLASRDLHVEVTKLFKKKLSDYVLACFFRK